LLPFKEKFEHEITNSLLSIVEQIISNSSILDFEGSMRDVEKYGYKIKLAQKNKKLNRKIFLE